MNEHVKRKRTRRQKFVAHYTDAAGIPFFVITTERPDPTRRLAQDLGNAKREVGTTLDCQVYAKMRMLGEDGIRANIVSGPLTAREAHDMKEAEIRRLRFDGAEILNGLTWKRRRKAVIVRLLPEDVIDAEMARSDAQFRDDGPSDDDLGDLMLKASKEVYRQ